MAGLVILRYFCLLKKTKIESDKSKFKLILIFIASIWCVAICFGLPKTLSIVVVENKKIMMCISTFERDMEDIHTITQMVFSFWFPSVIIIIFSILLLRFLKKWSKNSKSFRTTTIKRRSPNESAVALTKKTGRTAVSNSMTTSYSVKASKKQLSSSTKKIMIKRKTTRFVLAIVFSFLCCWSPLVFKNFRLSKGL